MTSQWINKISAVITGCIIGIITSIAAADTTGAVREEKHHNVVLQILGSGGPENIQGRASTGYLLWVDGKSRVMIDAGEGASLRFGQANAKVNDLDALLLSHLHADHTASTLSIIKRSYFEWVDGDSSKLIVAGPEGRGSDAAPGSELFPDTKKFIDTLVNSEDAAFAYLGIDQHHPDDHYYYAQVTAKPVPAKLGQVRLVMETEDMSIYALGVEHAYVPALAYRIDIKKNGKTFSIAFSGDQNARQSDEAFMTANKDFVAFVCDVDILVMHLAAAEPDEADVDSTYWHAIPSTIGRVANEAGVQKLVLGHLMSWSDPKASMKIIREQGYTGKMKLAKDLKRYPVNERRKNREASCVYAGADQ